MIDTQTAQKIAANLKRLNSSILEGKNVETLILYLKIWGRIQNWLSGESLDQFKAVLESTVSRILNLSELDKHLVLQEVKHLVRLAGHVRLSLSLEKLSPFLRCSIVQIFPKTSLIVQALFTDKMEVFDNRFMNFWQEFSEVEGSCSSLTPSKRVKIVDSFFKQTQILDQYYTEFYEQKLRERAEMRQQKGLQVEDSGRVTERRRQQDEKEIQRLTEMHRELMKKGEV